MSGLLGTQLRRENVEHECEYVLDLNYCICLYNQLSANPANPPSSRKDEQTPTISEIIEITAPPPVIRSVVDTTEARLGTWMLGSGNGNTNPRSGKSFLDFPNLSKLAHGLPFHRKPEPGNMTRHDMVPGDRIISRIQNAQFNQTRPGELSFSLSLTFPSLFPRQLQLDPQKQHNTPGVFRWPGPWYGVLKWRPLVQICGAEVNARRRADDAVGTIFRVCGLVHEGWDAGEIGTEEKGFEEGE